MIIRWRIPNDEIHLDDLDIDELIRHDIDEECGEQTRNRVIQ